ncbi:MAG: trypsin-like serine protease [Gammaproteobacteria bacterium]|nr:trypsin-like serine protease [Gammaproteobacteria bacterium]
MNGLFRALKSAPLVPLLFLLPLASHSSDGELDIAGDYPAVVGYYEYFIYLDPETEPEVAYAEESCSGALISEKVILTAAHCTSFNYTEDIGIDGYFDLVWVTIDPVATANDFRCFLVEENVPYIEFMTGEIACVPGMVSNPVPTFHPVAVAGVNNGVPIAHGLTHPDFLRTELRRDGRAQRVDKNLQNAPDVGVLILQEPVTGIVPLPIREVGELDGIPHLVGTPVISAGYGLNWAKISGQKPTTGLGPMSDLGGGSGLRRIARLGPVQAVHANSLLPRQNVNQGDDTVCFGDSGSPLFLEIGGQVEPVISGVLSGWTNWCQGSKDPYYRIDQQSAHDFIDCIVSNQDDVKQACLTCSAERNFGLCDGL